MFKKKVLKSSGRLTWKGLQQLQEQCYPSYNVCHIFMCPNNDIAVSVWDF